jgi:hypothetical protein
LCGLLSGGLQDNIGSQARIRGAAMHLGPHLTVRLPDWPADTPDTPQNLSSGTGERRAGADESSGKRLRRDLETSRFLVVQPAVGCIALPPSVLPPMGILARGIRLQI